LAFAAGWRQCGVQRIPFFYFLFFVVVKTAFLLVVSFIYPLSIFAFFDHFLSIIVQNIVKCRLKIHFVSPDTFFKFILVG
jgi:hypothetical protein